MEKPKLRRASQLIWDTISMEQKKAMLVFYDRFYKANEHRTELPFEMHELNIILTMNNKVALIYLTPELNTIFNTITDEQRLVVNEAYQLMHVLNRTTLIDTCEIQKDYNGNIPYYVFVLCKLFDIMNQNMNFKFFSNQNN